MPSARKSKTPTPADLSELSLVELTALYKAAEKAAKDKGAKGESIEPGAYTVNTTVHIQGNLSRAFDTEAYPSFKFYELVKAILLAYAAKTENPTQFLQELFGPKTVAEVLRKTPEAIIAKLNPKVVTAFEGIEVQAKEVFQSFVEKQPKSGATSVQCKLRKVE